MKITITLPDDDAAQYIADREDRGYADAVPGWVAGVQGLVERLVLPAAATWPAQVKSEKVERVTELLTVAEIDAIIEQKKP